MNKKELKKYISLNKSGVSSHVCCVAILQTYFNTPTPKQKQIYDAAELLDAFYSHIHKTNYRRLLIRLEDCGEEIDDDLKKLVDSLDGV